MEQLIQRVSSITGAGKIAFGALAITCLWSCSHGKAEEEPLVDVMGKQVAFTEEISDASIIFSDQENLYLRHKVASPMLSRLSLADGKLSDNGSFITTGNGPNEMSSLMLNGVSVNTHKIVFNDPNAQKFLEFDYLADTLSISQEYNQASSEAKIYHLALGHPMGSLVTYTLNRDGKAIGVVGLVSSNDGKFVPLSGVGNEQMKNLTLAEQIHYAPNSQVFVQSGGDKCLFVSSTGQYAEIFEINGNQAINKKVLVDNVPSFTLKETGRIASASDDLTFGFDVSVTSDRIYLMPRRVTRADGKNGLKGNPKYEGIANGPNFKSEVWIYDWTGNMLAKCNLNPHVSSFWVSESGLMSATSEDCDGEATIMHYDVSEF